MGPGPLTIMVVGEAAGTPPRSILLGLHQVALSRGWNLVMMKAESYLADAVEEWQAAAAVSLLHTPHWRNQVTPHLPIVVVEAEPAGLPCVRLDNAAIGRDAARHCLARQFRHFAAYGFWTHEWSRARANGFAAEINAAGFACSFVGKGESHLIDPLPDTASVTVHTEDWLRSLPRPCAVYVPCDSWAMAFVGFLRLRGFRVPQDLAVVSTDNDEVVCELTNPPLSSVIVPWRTLGQEVGLLLERVLAGADVSGPPRLVAPIGVAARHSTDLLAVADEEVAQALSFIHTNVHRGISVADVLRHVPVHQHRLERKFRTIVGSRMMEVIGRSRVDLARRFLATTDLAMPEVATRSGFANASKLSTAFRRETGMTPTDYRRRYRVWA